MNGCDVKWGDGQFFFPAACLLLVFFHVARQEVITSACQPVQRFSADIIPANLINNIMPSAASSWKHDKQPGGECESINIYDAIQGWTENYTKLASLIPFKAIIHCKGRKLIQHPLFKSQVECCHQVWFEAHEALFCGIYLVLCYTGRIGFSLRCCLNYRWSGHLHYGIHLFLPLSSCLILSPTNF